VNTERRFEALESWRGIAACLVALFHLDAYSHLYEVPFLRNSWLFVDFFFVLSGFIIAATYQERLRGGFGVGQFILLRLGRVYPLHFVMLALFVVFALLKVLARALIPGSESADPLAPFSSPAGAPDTILANVLLVHSLHLFDFLTWNPPSWSISTEFYTYILFALCLIVLRRYAWIALLFALIGGPALLVALGLPSMNTQYDWGMIRCVYGFAAGVVSWHLYKRAYGRSRRWLCGSVAEWSAVGLVILFVGAAGRSGVSIAAPFVFALVVLVFAYQAGSASTLLRRRPLVFLGMVSYSIYMTHVFVAGRLFDAASALHKLAHINLFTHREESYFLGTRLWHGDIAYVVYLAMVVGASWLTYSWIEKPAREWVRGRVQGRRQTAVAVEGGRP
jgi:peptidoglycan/LPS O-acetylase OafA/YrhL